MRTISAEGLALCHDHADELEAALNDLKAAAKGVGADEGPGRPGPRGHEGQTQNDGCSHQWGAAEDLGANQAPSREPKNTNGSSEINRQERPVILCWRLWREDTLTGEWKHASSWTDGAPGQDTLEGLKEASLDGQPRYRIELAYGPDGANQTQKSTASHGEETPPAMPGGEHHDKAGDPAHDALTDTLKEIRAGYGESPNRFTLEQAAMDYALGALGSLGVLGALGELGEPNPLNPSGSPGTPSATCLDEKQWRETLHLTAKRIKRLARECPPNSSAQEDAERWADEIEQLASQIQNQGLPS